MLELRGITVHYGNVNALRGVDVTVKDGEIICLLGANGAGKSTLLGAATSSIDACVEGEMHFDGKELLRHRSDEIIRSGIALSPEGRQLFGSMTVEENLRLGAYIRSDNENIGPDLGKIYTMFPRLQERKKQFAQTLSGGEQQMVAIGRALMSKPKLLMLDEPSLGLAPIIVREIMGLIKRINQEGVSILLVEQNAQQALQIANRGYVLEKGTIVLTDDAQTLLKDPRMLSTYLGEAVAEPAL